MRPVAVVRRGDLSEDGLYLADEHLQASLIPSVAAKVARRVPGSRGANGRRRFETP